MKLGSLYFYLLPLTWIATWGHLARYNNNTCFYRYDSLETQSGIVEFGWMVDSDQETVTFDINVNTKQNSVAIGFSNFEKLAQNQPVDLVVAGLDNDSKGYISDKFIQLDRDGKVQVLTDHKQDYNLKKSSKIGSNLTISFWRKWNTGDIQDITFDMSLVYIMWFDFDRNDDSPINITSKTIVHHLPVYLLDPEYTLNGGVDVKKWEIREKFKVPAKPTTYWCQFHKFPEKFSRKHHVIGFRPKVNSELARRHTHHIVLYKCDTNIENAEKMFEPLVNDKGDECYFSSTKLLPMNNCRTFMYVWGYGGKDFYLPNDAGFPIGESSIEYFVMEAHYDNPRSLNNIEIEVGVDIFYTDTLRENDAGLLMTGYGILPSLVIPPNSENMVVSGHCQPQCTEKFIPNDGINVFGVLLHSHTTGRKIAMHHFTSNETLEGNANHSLLVNDEHYNFQFQVGRLLLKRRKILPGDHLVTKCAYDTRGRNGSVVIGGLSTQEEMCLSFLWYYPKLPDLNGCTSSVKFSKVLRKFGIEQAKPYQDAYENHSEWIVTKPKKFFNRTLIDVLDNEVSWKEELKESLADMYEDDSYQNENHC